VRGRSITESRERRDQPPGHGGGYGQPPNEGGSATDLRGYLSLLWRRKWIIVPVLVLMPMGAYLHASGGTRSYEASAEVLLNRQSQALSGVNDLLVWQPERVIRTQTSIARLPVIAQRVVEAAKLQRDAGAFLGQSSVGSNDQIDLLTFRVRDTDPDLATQLANLYAQKYLEYRRDLDTKALREARKTVRRQIRSLRAQGLSVESSLYSSLIQKQEQLASAQTLQKSNALLVREASGAGQVAPQPRRAAFLALALALILALGLAFLVDTLDTRVRDPEELAERLGLPLLGSVPEPPRHVSRRRGLVMLDDLNSASAELFRILRTTLEVTALAGGCRSMMITSALQGEGKSTTAANLSIAFARTGRHVVLVDLDIRRPTLNRFFDLGGRPGITDVVYERASVEQAALRLTYGQVFEPVSIEELRRLEHLDEDQANGKRAPGVLEVIAAGTPPPNPGEFMVTSQLDATLDRLRQRADLIVVDGPPVLLSSDALTLSSKVDGLLFVARMNAFRREQIGDLYRALLASPAMKLGLVATDHAAVHKRSYYGAPARDVQVPASPRTTRLPFLAPAPDAGAMRSATRSTGPPVSDQEAEAGPTHPSEARTRSRWA
jgi:succinoglycan biosynthesis transport protein ExoP